MACRLLLLQAFVGCASEVVAWTAHERGGPLLTVERGALTDRVTFGAAHTDVVRVRPSSLSLSPNGRWAAFHGATLDGPIVLVGSVETGFRAGEPYSEVGPFVVGDDGQLLVGARLGAHWHVVSQRKDDVTVGPAFDAIGSLALTPRGTPAYVGRQRGRHHLVVGGKRVLVAREIAGSALGDDEDGRPRWAAIAAGVGGWFGVTPDGRHGPYPAFGTAVLARNGDAVFTVRTEVDGALSLLRVRPDGASWVATPYRDIPPDRVGPFGERGLAFVVKESGGERVVRADGDLRAGPGCAAVTHLIRNDADLAYVCKRGPGVPVSLRRLTDVGDEIVAEVHAVLELGLDDGALYALTLVGERRGPTLSLWADGVERRWGAGSDVMPLPGGFSGVDGRYFAVATRDDAVPILLGDDGTEAPLLAAWVDAYVDSGSGVRGFIRAALRRDAPCGVGPSGDARSHP